MPQLYTTLQPSTSSSSDLSNYFGTSEPSSSVGTSHSSGPLCEHNSVASLESLSSDQLIALVPKDSAGNPSSIGSIEHHRRLCTPCVWKPSSRGCKYGIRCGFCHLDHSDEKPHKVQAPDASNQMRKDNIKALIGTLRKRVESASAMLSEDFDESLSLDNSGRGGKKKTKISQRQSRKLVANIPEGIHGKPASLGSVGHFEGKCSPCNFFAKGYCKQGIFCGYCHLEHDNKIGERSRSSPSELGHSVRGIDNNGLEFLRVPDVVQTQVETDEVVNRDRASSAGVVPRKLSL